MVEIAGREERSDGIGIEKQSRHILHSAFVEALKRQNIALNLRKQMRKYP